MMIQFREHFLFDIAVRVILWVLFIWCGRLEPFVRVIQPEEMWLYRYPPTNSYVPASSLWLLILIVPTVLIFIQYMYNKNGRELQETLLSLSLTYSLNGFSTTFLKTISGRPRPDFFYRCFPDGKAGDPLHCTGDKNIVIEGRRSFPSGHASFAFASMIFITLYLAGKLQIFNSGGRADTWRLCSCTLPIFVACAISISRTCDYHHHWQDVVVGGMLGSLIAWFCYRQYFPSVFSTYSNIPHALQTTGMEN